ncbi:C6 finger domain transcription factor gliZ [Fusarium oxysporum f. sp. albedinis]|nr:C6 finger domain transcription factor gliZ [Fusarium oxysporum f. sp. albedinis]
MLSVRWTTRPCLARHTAASGAPLPLACRTGCQAYLIPHVLQYIHGPKIFSFSTTTCNALGPANPSAPAIDSV